MINAARHLEKYGFSVECVSPDATGRISAEDVLNRVREDTLLVSVMHVNNETGVIQPVHEIGQALAEKNVLFHVDATQSCGKLVKELQTLNYNMLSIGAHKLSGPQGIGALILKRGVINFRPYRQSRLVGHRNTACDREHFLLR